MINIGRSSPTIFLISRAVSRPFISGIFQSSSTISYSVCFLWCSSIICSASRPLSAQSACTPISFKADAALKHRSSLLSTTRSRQGGRTISSSSIVAFSRSRITWNSLPSPCLLFTSMVPPIISTITFVIDIPSPVPSIFCTFISSLEKVSNILFWNSSDIPIPLSFTRKWHLTCVAPTGESSWVR